jgi:ribokinase
VKTILNPAPAGDIDRSIFRYAGYVTPNETEAEYFTGVYRDDYTLEEWVQKCAARFVNMGASRVVITLGEKGAGISDGKTTTLYPAYTINAVDSTAAGDAFNGALAFALALNLDTDTAMRTACAAGALTASKAGAQTSIPDGRAIKQLMAQQG